jgi:hypothetical protein
MKLLLYTLNILLTGLFRTCYERDISTEGIR